jgi:hypothetical protein
MINLRDNKYTIFVFAFWLICSAVIGYYCFDVNSSWIDPDTFWHIRLGQEMIETGQIVRNALNGFDPTLPFISHEYGFEIIVGLLYNWSGYHALHIMIIVCMAILVWGLYVLASISRKEAGMSDFHPLLHLIIFIILAIIYMNFIKIRPQLISMDLILWFFIWCRKYQKTQNYKAIVILFLLALTTSNIHAGIFPILIVFWAMVLFESIVISKTTINHIIATVLIVISGLINSGGLQNVTYILQANKNNFADAISEWMPVNFRSNIVFLLFLILFIWSFKKNTHKSIFRSCFAFAILFLGVASSKSYLFLLLFLIYELAPAIESIPKMGLLKNIKYINQTKFAIPFFSIILLSFLVRGLTTQLEIPKEYYPVDETNFVLDHWSGMNKPKVLSTYDVGGYLMSRDIKVLCDGRFDPFIQDQSKGYRDKTAFERCLSASSNSDDLFEEVKYDKPDFVFIRFPNKNSAARDRILKVWGEPDFKGSYGVVWVMDSKRLNAS